MIEHHIENDFNAGRVQSFNHGFKFLHLPAIHRVGGVGGFRRKQADRVVAPIILQRCTSVRIRAGVIVFLEVANRQQFYRRDPQVPEVGNFFHETEKRAWMLDPGGWMARKSPHMEFVNNGVGERVAERLVGPPGKIVLHHQAPSWLYAAG